MSIIIDKLLVSRDLLEYLKCYKLIGNEILTYVILKKFKKMDQRYVRIINNNEFVILDSEYIWLKIMPDNKDYTILCIFDDKLNLVQCNFEMRIISYVSNDLLPTMKNYSINIVINGNGSFYILDEDVLSIAKENGNITEEEYNKILKACYDINYQYRDFKKCFEEIRRILNIVYEI